MIYWGFDQMEQFYLSGNNGAGVSPCMECERREIGCHARCPNYAAYRQAIEDGKAAVARGKAINKQYSEYRKAQCAKLEKRRKR